MRRAGRKDGNQADIVRSLRQIGVSVRVVNQEGLPDLLTHSRGKWLPLEVKQPGEALTAPQQALYDEAPFPIVETVDQALALFGVLQLTAGQMFTVNDSPFQITADGNLTQQLTVADIEKRAK